MGGIFDSIGKAISSNPGMAKAAGIGGLVGALLGGTGGVQRAARNAVVIGGSAALAGMAYNMYKKWQDGRQGEGQAQTRQPQQPYQSQPYQQQPYQPYQQPQQATAQSLPDFTSASDDPFAEFNAAANAGDRNAELLLKTMIFAARSDGHIDADERQNIMNMASQLFPDGKGVNDKIRSMLQEPLDPNTIASAMPDPGMAEDLYRLSAATIVADSESERRYLAALAQALRISPAALDALNLEAEEIRVQLRGQ